MKRDEPGPDHFGINLIGYFSADNGMGVTARAFAEALRRHGIPVSIVDVGNPEGDESTNRDWHEHYVRHAGEARHPVNLYIVTADFGSALDHVPPILVPGRLHLLMLWWEVPVMPPGWIAHLSRLDGIVACTPFIADIAANHLSMVPVIQARHPLALPPDIRPDRDRFGMPQDAFVLTSSFNPNSDPARKNPVAQIVAFRHAFPGHVTDVRLVIRVHHAGSSDLARLAVDLIARAAGDDARIQLRTETLSYREVLSFYASGDAYVSLHRAEGLGLGMMEAMALGKPVIATGWSGNTAFMDYSCACPVRYRLAPVRGHLHALRQETLGPQALWATPVVDDAIAWMRRLHGSLGLRQRIGAAAKARIASYQRHAWGRDWIDQIIALWEARAFLPAETGKYSRSPPT